MKVVILAGGQGSRLAEVTGVVPKPMVEIGGSPILWHIMKHFCAAGHREFVIALGHKGDVVRRFFADSHDDWTVHLVDTGLTTGTGGRLHQLAHLLGDAPFFLTYGDGVANVDLDALAATHRQSGCMATLTAVRPPARFGAVTFDGDRVIKFDEKPQLGEGWINGGFMVFEPTVFDDMGAATNSLEHEVLEPLAARGQLGGYRHAGFWQCMDTLRDRNLLEQLWQRGDAAWKTWK